MSRRANDANKTISAPALPSLDGLPAHIIERINEFNARPARRVTDLRTLGWSIIEVES